MRPPGEHESKIVEGDVADALEDNKKTTTSAERKDETESHGVVKGQADPKDVKADERKQEAEEEEEDDDDDEPQPPGYRNRAPMSYNSSGVKRPYTPGRPQGH
ncbi:hypothetical protein E1B28_003581 [Marasmius oreades]|uniref:Uncharacterized protein n=1 Tax=Marasmius oreades TaxID=181124 RepID=A0A9P7RMT9_9AGAR|nr:uncharacterized protein E1B28_003581 [Marasmius oreades]KAG7086061.1 hypothetical protein E1B28_003581 [Marasmius oreades]